jgi:hypothetical protein
LLYLPSYGVLRPVSGAIPPFAQGAIAHNRLHESDKSSQLRVRLSLLALVVANVLVAVQALRWEWGYYEVFLVYWFEALILGGFNALRMLVVGFFGNRPFGAWASQNVSASIGARTFLTLLGTGFFAIKFCAFALVTGFWIAILPAYLDQSRRLPSDSVLEGLRNAREDVGFAVAVLAASHGISFLLNFLVKREFATQSILGLLFWPYLRMGLALAVVVGGLFVVELNAALSSATTLVLVLMMLKTLADARSYRWEHRRAPSVDASAGSRSAGRLTA